MKFTFFNNIGFFLLAVYLILQGIVMLIPTLIIPTVIFGVLALVAGIFIFIGK